MAKRAVYSLWKEPSTCEMIIPVDHIGEKDEVIGPSGFINLGRNDSCPFKREMAFGGEN